MTALNIKRLTFYICVSVCLCWFKFVSYFRSVEIFLADAVAAAAVAVVFSCFIK